ncbi:hypothetical protein AGOR_G00042770 [Albula goreensis]|uniref:Glutamate decarboxylase 2 n=1 Tax=Albula goreensis TaxID=1534307 RepID=A0A8T3E0Q4_9TELE|nr:hypothetical protein AGOR_G00042770 [Albula goreensis]
MASTGFWSREGENAAGDSNQSPSTPRAWCLAAQKFTGDLGSKLYALLNVGEGNKTASSATKKVLAASENCDCNKPCNCSKRNLDLSNLYSTDLLPASDGDLATITFLQEVVDLMLAYIVTSFDRSTKVHIRGRASVRAAGVRHSEEDEEIIGWQDGQGDGIFSPGGAISNMYAMLVARFKMFPEVKEKGMSSVPRLAAFTSEHSHFSIKKGAAALGIGTDSVICIKADESGKMMPLDLERRIVEAKQKGLVPFFVSATAGTTVYGAFDPLHAVADICKKHNIWMHVDGAWGGSLLMSRKHRWKLDGVERANSVTWNPHKMMSVPLQSSALLVREEGLMQNCNQLQACYLFQQDKHYDLSYDTGDKALQCGRHVDIFKLWLMWRAKGTFGFEAQIDKCLELSEYLYNKIKDREGYEMVFDGKPQHTNVCFWYLPPGIRYLEDKEERRRRLHKVAPAIKARMMENGTTMVSYQPQGDKVNFFRMVISNPAATFEDIDFLIEEIDRLGQDL